MPFVGTKKHIHFGSLLVVLGWQKNKHSLIHFGLSASCPWLSEKQTFSLASLLVVLGWQKNKHFTTIRRGACKAVYNQDDVSLLDILL